LAERVQIGKVACILVILLMPAGASLDLTLELSKDVLTRFLWYRFLCSLLATGLLALHFTRFARRYTQLLSAPIALLPGFFIALMIYQTEGWNSTYYAGLNLILIAVSVVVHWSFWESVITCLLLIGMYVVACWLNPTPAETGVAFGNLYFLITTSIIVVTGNYFYNRLRQREFLAQHQLKLSEQQLEQNNRRLRELDDLKGQFFANISHELRTPLTLLLSPLETLLQPDSGLDEKTRSDLESMRENGMRLLKLINDLLELVKLDAGQMELQRRSVDLESFLRGILNAVKPTAEDRGIQTRCHVDDGVSAIHADPDKLEKVFLNLVFNSLKFTGAGGEIEITARNNNSDVLIDVRDTGKGIAPEHLRHLFTRFWQEDSTSNRKFQGAGIGLALVKELVVAHGGSVDATSESGRGTTMHIRLPVGNPPPWETQPATPPEPEEDPVGSTGKADWLSPLYRRADLYAGVAPLRSSAIRVNVPARSNQARVLVVDDEPDMLRFIKSQLRADYAVIEAADGAQGLTLATQFLPDVIVCDMMLPGKDGLTVCRELREQTSTKNLPFLMLTARADDATKLRALQAGANDFLTKPFSVAELRARVNGLCANNRLQRSLTENNRRLEGTIEQLKETELQLVQAEKVASLGRMSAGIIHEINNPLNFSLTALDWLTKAAGKLPPEEAEDFNDTLKDIRDGLKRVSVIVSDLRRFTHPQGGELSLVSAHQSAETALRFLKTEWKDKVDIRNEIPENFQVPAVSNRLMQVLLNLLQNSLDALRSQPEGAEAPQILLAARTEENSKVLIIRDNGPGIPEHHLPKVFDPFFTTKEVGEGTGLGLSICYRLLSDFGARLTINSEEGRYCEIQILFPAAPVPNRDATNFDLNLVA
jgi:signal transduction histidine kinase